MSDRQTARPQGVEGLPAIIEMADTYKLDARAFVFTFRAVAMPKDHTDAEFVSCCLVAKEHGLNPLTKEIYFMRTKAGVIQPIVSVDGWIRKLNEHPQFDGLEFDDHMDDAGKITSITCTIYRKDRTRPTKVTEYLDECLAAGGPAWKSSPKRMLRHRTLTQGARYAIGFAGVMDRDEFEAWQSMRDVTPAASRLARSAPLPVPDIPDIPDEPALPAPDQAAVLRQLERRLEAEPHRALEIEAEFAARIMAMDEEGREAAVDMVQAAKRQPIAAK